MPHTNRRPNPRAHALLTGCAILALAAASAPSALGQPARGQTAPGRVQPAPTEARYAVNIPAGPLDQALVALAAQTHQQLLYPPELARDRTAPPLAGRYTAEEALARLLGPAVAVAHAGDNVLVLKAASPAGSGAPAGAASQAAPDRPFAARAGIAPAPAPRTALPATVAEAPPTQVDELTVTGTHLRGVRDTPSPVLVLDRADLERSGQPTLAAALAALPQNFGGNASEVTALRAVDRDSNNNVFASGLSLRGLGADATLVLVNGRRLGGTGVKGDFADISAIPTAAVERVEILLDGASALYGADAVAGVVNIILRRGLDRPETQLSLGTGTDGGPFEGRFGQAAGFGWSGGGGFLAYELHRREALMLTDRAAGASADLRPLGGRDWRQTFAHPGNLLVRDPVSNLNVPAWAIPDGQDGTALRPTDFRPGQVNLRNQNAGVSLLPLQTRNSLYFSAHQALGDRLEVSGDLRFSARRFRSLGGWPIGLITVTRANPWFVSPNGSASDLIAYAYDDDLPPTVTNGGSESLGASLGAGLALARGWRADGYLAFAQEIGETHAGGVINSTFLNEALGTTADRTDTAFSAARDGYFNPFGAGPGTNNPIVLAFISQGFSQVRDRQQTATANLQADGPVLDLPGGPLRLAVGLHARREAFLRTGASFSTGVAPSRLATVDARRQAQAMFAEARAPLSGSDAPLGRLELSLAVRHERYDDFGDTTNPKAGLIWAPADGVRMRASYGTSFRAPALRELRDTERYNPSLLPLADGGRVLSLVLSGGNPDLRPETAVTWTAGVDLAPPRLPGLRLSASWFRTRFEDRIGQPGAQNLLTALFDPDVSAFVDRIDPAASAEDRARITALITSPNYAANNGVFPAEAYGAIVDGRYANTAALEVDGLDLEGAWARDLGADRLTLAGNLSWLFDYKEQLTPTGAVQQRLALATYPARLRTRLTADWAHGAWGVTAALNHASGFHDLDGRAIRSHQTVDLQGRLEGAPDTPWAGLRLTLGVRNLLDRAPPFYDSPAGLGFDSANADAVGRVVTLQLTRSW